MGVWEECNKKIHKLSLEESDGMGLVYQFMTKLDHYVLMEALSVARMVWHQRNGFVHGSGFTEPKKILAQAQEVLTPLSEAQRGAMVASSNLRIAVPRWMKPYPWWVKLNWDAAVSSAAKTMGVGVVVRNAKGSFMLGLTASLPYVRDPLVAEVMAAWRAMELGRELGFQRINLEGDSLITVKALNKDQSCSSSYGQLINDIRVCLSSFLFHTVSHVSRQANNAAHVLAQYALALSSDLVWKEECPPPILHIVMAEKRPSV
jgi:ribonuclease HI